MWRGGGGVGVLRLKTFKPVKNYKLFIHRMTIKKCLSCMLTTKHCLSERKLL